MFAIYSVVSWACMAVFTLLWGVTRVEWYGFTVGVLLAVRVALLVALIGALCYPEIRKAQRQLHTPVPQSIRLGDYLLDFVFVLTYGWLAQSGAHFGLYVLALYMATIMLGEIMATILEVKR